MLPAAAAGSWVLLGVLLVGRPLLLPLLLGC
jgi:hypothetical protein